MAFALTALVLMSQSNRADGTFSRVYLYSSADAAATIIAAGYFNAAGNRLAVGDLILVTGGIGGTAVTQILRVTAATVGSDFTVVDDLTDASELANVLAGSTAFTKVKVDGGTATATGGAATLNKSSGKVTSEALTTAAAGVYTLTLTDSQIAAGDIVLATVANGTNTQGVPIVGKITPAAGSVTIDIRNEHASQAFNGTLVIGFVVIKQ